MTAKENTTEEPKGETAAKTETCSGCEAAKVERDAATERANGLAKELGHAEARIQTLEGELQKAASERDSLQVQGDEQPETLRVV